MHSNSRTGRVGDHLHEGAEGVELLLGILIVITLARNANAHPVGHVLDPLAPQILVELLIYPHVGGAHHLLGELAHLRHSTGCPGLEGPVPRKTRASTRRDEFPSELSARRLHMDCYMFSLLCCGCHCAQGNGANM